jgi:hypothetical protein
MRSDAKYGTTLESTMAGSVLLVVVIAPMALGPTIVEMKTIIVNYYCSKTNFN